MRRTLSLALLFAAVLSGPAAAQWSGEFPAQPPPPDSALEEFTLEDVPEPPAPKVRLRSDRFSDIQLARIQATNATGGGITFALGAAVATYLATGCVDEDFELPGCAVADDLLPFVAVGAYVLGSAVAVHQSGWTEGRQGGFAATLLGSAVGVGLGALAIGVGPFADAPAPVALTLFLGVSQAFPVMFYQWSDRIHATAGWTPPPGFDAQAPTVASLAQGLRPELEVDVLRF